MLPRGARHAGTMWEWLEIPVLFQNCIRSHARWSLVKTVTSITLFKCANYWHIIAITHREHIKLLYLVRCTTNDAPVICIKRTRNWRSEIIPLGGLAKKNSALTFHEAWDSFQRCRWRNEWRNTFFSDSVYSSLKLDNIVFHDQKITETFAPEQRGILQNKMQCAGWRWCILTSLTMLSTTCRNE